MQERADELDLNSIVVLLYLPVKRIGGGRFDIFPP